MYNTKTIGNLFATLIFVLLLAGTNNICAMQKQKRKARRCTSEQSPLDGCGPAEFQKPERQKLKLQAPKPKARSFFPEALESKQPEEDKQAEDGEQDPMDSVYINNPFLAEEMEDAELFANNGKILNDEYNNYLALIQQECIAQEQAKKRAQAQVQAQVQQQALAQKAYLRFLASQASTQQRQVRAMRPQMFACENCSYINEALLPACALCGQAR